MGAQCSGNRGKSGDPAEHGAATDDNGTKQEDTNGQNFTLDFGWFDFVKQEEEEEENLYEQFLEVRRRRCCRFIVYRYLYSFIALTLIYTFNSVLFH